MPPPLQNALKSPQPRLGNGWRVCVTIATLLLVPPALAAQPGLDQAESMDKFFGTTFPSTSATSHLSPATLSQTGIFTNLATLEPRTGLIPYGINSTPWDDGAKSHRWIGLPSDGTPNTPAERIINSEFGDWTFPTGTVIVKHIDLPIDDTNPALTKKIETQLLIRGTDAWYPITYRWREDETDADLVLGTVNATRNFTIPTGASTSRSQTWTYHVKVNCAQCHNSGSGNVLGVRMHQLNGNFLYPKTGRTANQLHTLNTLGFFTIPWTEATISGFAKSVSGQDFAQPLEKRARSYLDINCAHCHRNTISGGMDLRFQTDLMSTNLVHVVPTNSYGIAEAKRLNPRAVSKSILHHLTTLLGTNQMPPLGKNRLDTSGSLTLAEWINQFSNYEQPVLTGLTAEYYNGSAHQTKRLTVLENNISFNWAATSPDPVVNVDNFSAVYIGKLYAPKSGTYTLTVDSDDGVRLWVRNLMVIDSWTPVGLQSNSGPVVLEAETYNDFVLHYRELSGTANIRLRWSGPDINETPISANRFFRTTIPLPGPPFANQDAGTLFRGGAMSIPILANDTDTENDVSPNTVTIVRQPKHGTVAVNSLGNLTYTHNFTSGGNSDEIHYTVNDAAGTTSNRALVRITLQSDTQNWRNLYFTPTELANPVISDWDADPDGDGRTNLLEYATNSLPRTPSQDAPNFISQPNASTIRVTYPKRPGADVLYALEISSNGTVWQPAAPDVQIIENSSTQLRVDLPLLPSQPKRFLRLRATLIP